MSATDWLQAVSLVVVLANTLWIIALMRRAAWFRSVGWIGLTWMFHATIFHIAILVDHLVVDYLPSLDINAWSSGLRLQAYLSASAILFLVAQEVKRNGRGK